MAILNPKFSPIKFWFWKEMEGKGSPGQSLGATADKVLSLVSTHFSSEGGGEGTWSRAPSSDCRIWGRFFGEKWSFN